MVNLWIDNNVDSDELRHIFSTNADISDFVHSQLLNNVHRHSPIRDQIMERDMTVMVLFWLENRKRTVKTRASSTIPANETMVIEKKKLVDKSGVFEALFNRWIIRITSDKAVFKEFIALFDERARISMKNVVDLIKLSFKYNFEDGVEQCVQFYKDKMDSSIALNVLSNGISLKCTSLIHAIIYIVRNIVAIYLCCFV